MSSKSLVYSQREIEMATVLSNSNNREAFSKRRLAWLASRTTTAIITTLASSSSRLEYSTTE